MSPSLSKTLKAPFCLDDPYLLPYLGAITARYDYVAGLLEKIETFEGSLSNFADSWKRFGLHREETGQWYREWAPAAQAVALTGDFCSWDRNAYVCERDHFGVFSVFIPNAPDGTPRIPDNSKVKASVTFANGAVVDRIPAWIFRVVQIPPNVAFEGVYWDPPTPFRWKHSRPVRARSLRIYEAHVGMSSKEPVIASYDHFRIEVLPRIVKLGYNVVQLMAIMEHPYYASFGYQVSMPFAACSRFGTPSQLMELIDEAHGLGLLVILDVVHSHSAKNVLDGLNQWDGSDNQYFHSGEKGEHRIWDSRLFDYSKWEVVRYLLSNLAFYSEYYKFDGFRFDGVSSMLYTHHGIGEGFTGNYDEYFTDVDGDALAYLTLANCLVHEINPNCITIAEDVSGFPGLCRKVSAGGVGFDYRLGMGLPDMWKALLNGPSDDDWDMGKIAHTLIDRRYREKTVAYVESHDQALVGDKTTAFWLMDKEMYWHMSVLQPLHPVIERGIALHKIIRLITYAMGGEAFMTFMGNEFGHPEWVDFPRAGNENSLHYARRRWDLADDDLLRYKFLNNWDIAMNDLEKKFGFLSSEDNYVLRKHQGDKVIVFERGKLLFVFNFHPTESFSDYGIGVRRSGTYKLVLSSDDECFMGHARVSHETEYFTQEESLDNMDRSLMIYTPSRTALAFSVK